MKACLTILLGAGLIASFTGCGSGGGHDDTTTMPTTTMVSRVIYDSSGRTVEKGLVQAGTEIREGEWWSYYSTYSATSWGGVNQLPKWRRWYKEDAWVQEEPWRDWNSDGSIREDYTDALIAAP